MRIRMLKPYPFNLLPDTMRKALTSSKEFEYLFLKRRLRKDPRGRAGREVMEVKWLSSQD